MDSVAAAELLGGCRSRKERGIIEKLLAPFEGAGRVVSPNHRDFSRAGDAISKLRQAGVTLKNPGAALLDGLQAADAARIGALLVTENVSDFKNLARIIPVSVQSFEQFTSKL